MARTAIPVQTLSSKHGGEVEDLTWTAADDVNNMEYVGTGNEIVLIKNASGGSLDVVFKSVADPYERTGDLTVSTGASDQSVAGRFPRLLWNQSDGLVDIDIADDTSLSLAVIRLP
jgi:hypothetical protein